MAFTFDRQTLSQYGDLAIDATIAIARLVDGVTAETSSSVLIAIRAVLRVLSLAVRGKMDAENARKMIEDIGKRFQDRVGTTEAED